jgi:Zn-dependent M28 family amino/carboxypeptidase
MEAVKIRIIGLAERLFKLRPGLGKILLAGMALTLGILEMPTIENPHAQPAEERATSEKSLAARLTDHVRILASEIGERNVRHPEQLALAASYIKQTWQKQGYVVKTQDYTVEGVLSRNIEIELPGRRQPEKVIVIGAHYDSVVGCPGANDNGSGVAALLELSRRLHDRRPAETIRFVAFVNEEPPFFLSRRMGSRVYAARARQKNEPISAMLSLETIGYYADRPGSQHYPFPVGFFYPDTANFIAFVSNLRSRRLLHQAADAFSRHSSFPSQRLAAPFWLTGIGWSDQWSFWAEGYPAIMVTDTAFFRYDHYHRATDTADKLVYDRMAEVVAGLAGMLADLAGVVPGQEAADIPVPEHR